MLADAPKQYVWHPQPGQSDTLTLYLEGGIVEVTKQAHIPLELASPIFDLAGLYSPLVLMTELPAYGQEGDDLGRTVFYQHLDVIHLGQLVEQLNALEPGWSIQGRVVVSPRPTSLGLDRVREQILACRLPEALPKSESKPEPEPMAMEQRGRSPLNLRPWLWGAVGFGLGLLSVVMWNAL